jgi:hypothetical protein
METTRFIPWQAKNANKPKGFCVYNIRANIIATDVRERQTEDYSFASEQETPK